MARTSRSSPFVVSGSRSDFCCRWNSSALHLPDPAWRVGRWLARVPNRFGLCAFASRTSPVFGQQPAQSSPAVPVVPGDLDTLRAWAVAAGDVRSAVLLVGSRDGPSTDMKEPITVPNKE